MHLPRIPGFSLTSAWLLILGLSMTACSDRFGQLSWQSEWTLPLAQSETGLRDLVQDSSLQVNSEGVFMLVLRDTLTQVFLQDLVTFPPTELSQAVRLDSIQLGTDTITQVVTLGALAQQLSDQGNIVGQIIINNHQNTLPFVPAVQGLNSGAIPIDASDFFEYALLDSGFLELTIQNDFPLTLEMVVLDISNATLPGAALVRDTFDIIPAGASRSRTYELHGKEVESSLVGELVNLDIADSANVYIDTSKAITVNLVARDLKAREATAIFPAQTVLELSRNVPYRFGSGNESVRITDLIIRSGQLEAESTTTIEDSLLTIYQVSNALDQFGNPVTLELTVLPAPPGGVRDQFASQTLSGFTMDMSLGGTSWNQLEDYFRVDLLFSGNLVTLDQEDSLRLTFRITEIEPTFAAGYFGSQTFSYQGEVAVDWQDALNLGQVRLADPRARIVLENGVGIDGEIEVRDLQVRNQSSGESARLISADLLSGSIGLARPYLPDTFGIATSSLTFDRDQSNLVQVLDLGADRLSYDLALRTNPNGDPFQFDDFATDQSSLSALLEIELPLDGVMESLVLSDTVDLDPGPVDDIPAEEGILRLRLDNEFPLEAQVDARIEAADGTVLLLLADDFLIRGADPVNGGRTQQPAESQLEISLTKAQLEEVLENGTRLIYEYQLATHPGSEAVKFYSDYQIRTQVIVQFPFQTNR